MDKIENPEVHRIDVVVDPRQRHAGVYFMRYRLIEPDRLYLQFELVRSEGGPDDPMCFGDYTDGFVKDVLKAEPFVSGSIKFDACTDLSFAPHCLHFCEGRHLMEIGAVLKAVHDNARILLGRATDEDWED